MPPPPPPHGVTSLPHQCSVLLRRLAASRSLASSSSFLLALRCLHARLLTSSLLHAPLHPHLTLRLIHLYTLSRDLPAAATLFRADPFCPVSATSLVAAYAAAGHLPAAVSFFDVVPPACRDTVLHNAVISAYARACHATPAIAVFRSLLAGGFAVHGDRCRLIAAHRKRWGVATTARSDGGYVIAHEQPAAAFLSGVGRMRRMIHAILTV